MKEFQQNENEKVLNVANKILKKHKKAFEDLGK